MIGHKYRGKTCNKGMNKRLRHFGHRSFLPSWNKGEYIYLGLRPYSLRLPTVNPNNNGVVERGVCVLCFMLQFLSHCGGYR